MTRRTSPRARAAAEISDLADLSASKLRLFGVALVCAKVALVPVVFDYLSDVPFTVAKALLSHGLAYALVGVIAGLLIQFGRSVFVWSWLHVPALAFLAANAAATIFAANTSLALYGAHARMLGLGTIADCVLLYFAVILLVRTRAEGTAVIASGIAGSAAVLAYELVQLAGKDPFAWNVNPAVRPFSTLGQTTTLAEYLTVIAIGVAALGIFEQRLGVRVRVSLLVFAGLQLVGVVMTQTRSSLLGMLAGALMLAFLTWAAHPDKRARRLTLLGSAGGSAALVLLLLFTPLGARVLGTVEIPRADVADEGTGPRLEQSAEVRVSLYRIAFNMVRDRPLLGYGPDNLSAVLPAYRSNAEAYEVQQSLPTSGHSWVSYVAVSGGLIGLVSFVAIASVALVLTLKTGFHPATWAALAMLTAFLGAGLTTVNDVATEWLFWASAAVIGAVSGRSAFLPRDSAAVLKRRAGRRSQPMQRRIVGYALAGVGLAFMFSTVSALEASRAARQEQQMRLSGNLPRAIEFGLRATRLDPGRATYWDGLGLAYIGSQRVGDAISAFDRASSLAPYDVRYLGDLTRAYLVLVQAGDTAAIERARESAERAFRIDPNNPQANLTRAIAMQVTGNLPEALKSVERALALDPLSSNAQLYLTATQVLLANGKPGDAIVMARRAIGILPNVQDSVAIRIELARALLATGEPAQALAELDAVLVIRPNDSAAKQLRAQIQAGQVRQ